MTDLKFAFRQLWKNRGFTAMAAITLALGIGVNTAVFDVLDRLMIRTLPVRAPHELARVGFGGDPIYYSFDYPLYVHCREHAETYSGLAAYSPMPVSLTVNGEAERVQALLASENYFTMLGVEPALGRAMSPRQDAGDGAAPAAWISHTLWQRRFGAEPSVIGATIHVNRQPFTIAGIAPREFSGTIAGSAPDIYLPITKIGLVTTLDRHISDPLTTREMSWVSILGRLKPGATRESAQAELRTLAAGLDKGRPGSERIVVEEGSRGHGYSVQRIRFSVMLIQTAAGLVLLMVCANLGGLLFARAASRRREIAIHFAVGATRSRLVRQLMSESLLLALLGCAGGCVVAGWVNSGLATFVPPESLPMLNPGMDLRLFGLSCLLALVTGVLVGLAPCVLATRTEWLNVQWGASVLPYDGRRWAPRSILVVAQIAMAVVVLVSAGLCLRSAERLCATDPGYDTAKVLVMSFDLSRSGYQPGRGQLFLEQLLQRVRTVPGVEAASLAGSVVLGGNRIGVSLDELEGYQGKPGESISFRCDVIAPDYFRTLGLPLWQGRDFTPRDTANSAPVAVINDAMARRYWPGQDIIGRRLRLPRLVAPPLTAGVGLGLPGESEPVEIIGLVRDGKFGLNEERQPAMYRPVTQVFQPALSLHARSAGDPKSLIASLRAEARALDEHLAFFNIRTLEEQKLRSVFVQRAIATLLAGLGLVGLGLAALGLYGVTAFSVRQRTREIGVRMALGAQHRDVLGMVLSQGLKLALVGVAIGLAGAFVFTRLLRGLLFEVSPNDPLILASMALVLIAAAMLATWLPARRATQINPIEALHCE